MEFVAGPGSASIVIPAWRLPKELEVCLDAIAEQVSPPPYEVIVVVNGSDPAVLETVEKHRLKPQIIPLAANIGFGRACNIGAAQATGEFLVFLNDDTQVEPGWLAALVAAGQRVGVGAVTCLVLEMDGRTIDEAGARLDSTGTYYPFGRGLTVPTAEAAGLMEPRPIDYGSAAAILVRRELFEQLQGFDPVYAPAYFEDVDLQFRIHEAGWRIWYEPKAQVRHLINGSTKGQVTFRDFAIQRSGRVFRDRWEEVLTSAPSQHDPPDVLIDIPQRDRPLLTQSESDRADAKTAAQVFRHVAQDSAAYIAWLEAELAQTQTKLARATGTAA